MNVFRLSACVLYAAMAGWAVHNADISIREKTDEHNDRQRYRNLMLYAMPLPATIIILFLALLLFRHQEDTLPLFLANMAALFFHMTLYYIILLSLLPLLRKKLSASACATLWMAPHFLYLTFYVWMEQTAPRWVIFVPQALFQLCVIVWLTGAAAILLWKITSHLLYRRKLLTDAALVTEPEILALWQAELHNAHLKKATYPIYRSPAARTPLSIGLFKRSICVILPQRSYTPEELTLILRHELIHISRQDGANKFFLLVCTALCWFSPFSWLAMHRSADDMELSCDELALLDTNEQQRKKYAELLLETAGDSRGFSTCLSASAQALRYRMSRVLHPGKRSAGAFAMALAVFLLLSSFGSVAFAFTSFSGNDALFPEGERSDYRVEQVRDTKGSYFLLRDEDALWDYLASMTYYRVQGYYSFEETSAEPQIYYASSEKYLSVSFSEKAVKITPHSGRHRIKAQYVSTQAPDLEKIHALLLPADPPPPFPAQLSLRCNPADSAPPQATGWLYYIEPESPPDEEWGGSEPILRLESAELSTVELAFSSLPRAYTVQVHDSDGRLLEEIEGDTLENDLLPLHHPNATYTVRATFDEPSPIHFPAGTVYHMIYKFHIAAPQA